MSLIELRSDAPRHLNRKAGDDLMMDVACFCGCVYSFSGDLGVCPKCGKYVTLSHVTTEEEEQMRSELDAILQAHDGPVVSDLRARWCGRHRAHAREADASPA